MRSRRFLPILLCFLAWAGTLWAYEVKPKGQALAQVFDRLDVQRHWLAGAHVNWRTGDSDSDVHAATHCSAFVASACQRLGVYILRPPEHGQTLLANAQYEWLLSTEGTKHGWKPVKSPSDAQRLANEGHLVVATCQNADPKKPGHIALVRPNPKSVALIEAEGPQIIQAGTTNYNSTSLKTGFRQHPDAWHDGSHHAVAFYEHPLEDLTERLAPAVPKSAARP
jgi:hypothetical protein